MAAFTTNANGNWSAAGTWTTTPPTGGPGDGDTATIGNHDVTVDSAAGGSQDGNVILGTDSGNAITSAATSAHGITVSAGCSLRIKGNLSNPSSKFFTLTLSSSGSTPGGKFFFYPPSDGSTRFKFAKKLSR